MKKFLLSAVSLLLLCQPAQKLFARGNTPMDAFIQQIKDGNTFVNVNDIWKLDHDFDKSGMLTKVDAAEPLLIDYSKVGALIQNRPFALSLTVPGLGGVSYTLELGRHDFFTSDFEVHAKGANNTDSLVNWTPGLYYRGVVKGIPGSVVAFSFYKNEVYGIYSIPNVGNFVLVPNTMTGKYYDYNQHYIVYNDKDLKIKEMGPGCETDKLPDMPEQASKTSTFLNNKVYQSCTEIRVMEVADYAMYQSKGSSTTTVTNFLTSLFNVQSTIYRNEGVPITLKYVQVNTATDAFASITAASSFRFLNKFGWVTQNTLHGCDLAILTSTKFSGGYGALGGVAWVKAMCASYNPADSSGPYGYACIDNSAVVSFPTYSWDATVMVHEMGHLVGSPHTHRCCWNPAGTGNTAIDGCYTIEGTCSNPGLPAAGGTMMSYCHLTSTGINFSNGFGKQPGDTIRTFTRTRFSGTCGAAFNADVPVQVTNRVLSANRECYEMSTGITYYWNDNSTDGHADDTLVLMIKKNSQKIGTLDSTGFSVSSGTIASWGGGTAQNITFPSGTSLIQTNSKAIRRYWKINATSTPASNVEVIFPLTTKDSSDLDPSVPGTPLKPSFYYMYKTNGSIDPNPANGFTGATSSNFAIYTPGSTASTSVWSLTRTASTLYAHMLMTNLTGGGTAFYTYKFPVGVEEVEGDNFIVYPNPADRVINIEAKDGMVTFVRLCDMQGRVIATMNPALNSGPVALPVDELSNGLYFLEVQTATEKVVRKITVQK